MKRFLFLTLFVAGFLGTERLCHKATDGFALNKITYSLVDELVEEAVLFSVEQKLAKDILTEEKFHYLASGAQCYAFVSENKKYVVKFFKFQHMRIPPWLKYIPLPAPLNAYRNAKLEKKRQSIQELFNSFKLADRYLKEETGILFLHLCQSSYFDGKMTIYDKIGGCHKLDLDSTYFVLQTRADLAYRKINEWMKKGKISKARDGIRSLVAVAMQRCEKGIYDKDPDFKTNFGFVNDRATQIDIGRFSKKTMACDPAICGPEIIRITKELRSWLKTHHEELVEILDDEIKKAINDHGIKT